MLRFLAVALIAATGVSQAGTLVFTGVDPSKGVNITFNNNGTLEQGFAGVILGTYNGTSVAPLFCVDLFTDINLGTYGSTALAPRAIRNEDRAAWLYLNQYATVVSTDTGLAFQLAIWDIVHDNGDGFASGLVQSGATSIQGLTQTQINLANAYVAASAGHAVTSGVSIYRNVNTSTGVNVQTLMGVAAPVPEPATYSMMLAGVSALCLVRRRKR
jgi:hypothetical protein